MKPTIGQRVDCGVCVGTITEILTDNHYEVRGEWWDYVEDPQPEPWFMCVSESDLIYNEKHQRWVYKG